MGEFYNIDELIANLHIDLGFNVETLSPVFKRWIYEAMIEIGGNRAIEKKEKFILANLMIKKPDDFLAAKHIYLTRENTNELCVEPIYDSSVWCCHQLDGCGPYVVNQTLNTFCFSSNVESHFTHVLLHYYACPLDEDGNPLVPTVVREAVEAFVEWKYYRRVRNQFKGGRRGTNPVTQFMVSNARKEWLEERRRARGIMNTVTVRELQEIGEDMMYRVTNEYPKALTPYLNRYLSSSV